MTLADDERFPDAAAGGREATAADVAAAWRDPKLANVLYHDWEASTYDEKWSISYDERCIDYARDRFQHVAGDEGWPYGRALSSAAVPASSSSTSPRPASSTRVT